MNCFPMSADKLRERLVTNFSSSSLTLISIIQGVPLGILLTMVYENYFKGVTNLYWSSSYLYPLFSFFGLLIVFFSYHWFVSIVFARPNFTETIVPFILGLTQTVAMFFFNKLYWWLFFGVFCFTGAYAYFNTIISLKKGLFAEDIEAIYHITKTELLCNIACCMLAGSFCFFIYFWYKESPSCFFAYDYEYYFVPLGLIMSALVIKTQFYFLPKIYNHVGLTIE